MKNNQHELKNSLIAIFDLLRIVKKSTNEKLTEEILDQILKNENTVKKLIVSDLND